MKNLGFILFLSVFSTLLYAADIPLEFTDPDQEQRFDQLVKELRCLVCQNQTLADSNADLAQDLRQEVYEKLIAGNSNDDIIRYLTDRYGDFVLYRPPVKPVTYLLWGGPFLFLLIGILVARSLLRKQEEPPLTDEELQQASRLLNSPASEKRESS